MILDWTVPLREAVIAQDECRNHTHKPGLFGVNAATPLWQTGISEQLCSHKGAFFIIYSCEHVNHHNNTVFISHFFIPSPPSLFCDAASVTVHMLLIMYFLGAANRNLVSLQYVIKHRELYLSVPLPHGKLCTAQLSRLCQATTALTTIC